MRKFNKNGAYPNYIPYSQRIKNGIFKQVKRATFSETIRRLGFTKTMFVICIIAESILLVAFFVSVFSMISSIGVQNLQNSTSLQNNTTTLVQPSNDAINFSMAYLAFFLGVLSLIFPVAIEIIHLVDNVNISYDESAKAVRKYTNWAIVFNSLQKNPIPLNYQEPTISPEKDFEDRDPNVRG